MLLPVDLEKRDQFLNYNYTIFLGRSNNKKYLIFNCYYKIYIKNITLPSNPIYLKHNFTLLSFYAHGYFTKNLAE